MCVAVEICVICVMLWAHVRDVWCYERMCDVCDTMRTCEICVMLWEHVWYVWCQSWTTRGQGALHHLDWCTVPTLLNHTWSRHLVPQGLSSWTTRGQETPPRLNDSEFYQSWTTRGRGALHHLWCRQYLPSWTTRGQDTWRHAYEGIDAPFLTPKYQERTRIHNLCSFNYS